MTSKDPYGDPKHWDKMKKLKVGRPKALSSPGQLWELACEYFKRTANTPIVKEDFVRSGANGGKKVKVKYRRPFTWAGLEAFLAEKEILQSLDEYRSDRNKTYGDFSNIVRAINRVMYSQKFDGAAVGDFKENLIARELGLSDKQVNLNANTDTAAIDYSQLKQSTLEDIAANLKDEKV